MRKGFWWTNICNFLNKLLALFRTNLKILIVGDNVISDLFILADKSVSLFRRLFVDGNFQAIFNKHYAEYKIEKKEKSFATSALIFMLKNLSIITFFFCLTAPLFVKGFYQNPVNEKILLSFLIFLSPLIIGIFLMSFLTSILNANNKFEISGIAPLIGNSVYVLLLFLCYKNVLHLSISVILILGALSYAFIQVALMLFFSMQYFGKYENKILKKEHNENKLIKNFSIDMYKGLGINLITPLSEVFTGIMATLSKSGVFSHIEYGHRYIYSIFSIISIPLTNAAIPSLSKLNAEKDIIKFQEKSTEFIILTHILSIPTIFFVFYCTEDLIFFFIKNVTKIQNKEAMCKSITIISLSLYLLMQNRILNAINNTSGKINDTLKGSVIYGVTTILAVIILPIFMDFGLVWAGNVAYLFQFLYLIYSSLKSKLIKFSKKQVIDLVASLALGWILVQNFQKFNIFLSQQFFGNICLLLKIISASFFGLIYLAVFWHYTKKLFIKSND